MRRIILLLLASAAGCNDPTYLSERRPLESHVPMAVMGMMQNNNAQTDTDLYVLPVRSPSDAEKSARKAEQMQRGLPMDVPWAGVRDFDIEIEYSLKNLDTGPVTAYLALLGGNEFGDYQPMLYLDPRANAANQTPPPPLLGGSPISLKAGEVHAGVFREDELSEASLDLEAITRYPDPAAVRATPFEVIEHNSTVSMVGRENIPKNDVTPSMVRFVFNLSADGHVACDYTVRVRDHSGKLALPTDLNLYVSTAAMLAAPGAPPAPMAPAGP